MGCQHPPAFNAQLIRQLYRSIQMRSCPGKGFFGRDRRISFNRPALSKGPGGAIEERHDARVGEIDLKPFVQIVNLGVNFLDQPDGLIKLA